MIRVGDVVRLPDGDVGTVSVCRGRSIEVVHHDRTVGRGPWIYRATQVTVVGDPEWDDYHSRCMRRA